MGSPSCHIVCQSTYFLPEVTLLTIVKQKLNIYTQIRLVDSIWSLIWPV